MSDAHSFLFIYFFFHGNRLPGVPLYHNISVWDSSPRVSFLLCVLFSSQSTHRQVTSQGLGQRSSWLFHQIFLLALPSQIGPQFLRWRFCFSNQPFFINVETSSKIWCLEVMKGLKVSCLLVEVSHGLMCVDPLVIFFFPFHLFSFSLEVFEDILLEKSTQWAWFHSPRTVKTYLKAVLCKKLLSSLCCFWCAVLEIQDTYTVTLQLIPWWTDDLLQNVFFQVFLDTDITEPVVWPFL